MTAKLNGIDRDDWDKHWSSHGEWTQENPAQEMRHALVLSALRSLGKLRLLVDIGSGQGDFLERACCERAADRLLGFELSQSGVDMSRNRVPGVEFYQVDLFAPPDSVEGFVGQCDAAVCTDVIEHVDDPAGFLQRTREYLKPGGVLVLTVPGGPMSAFDRHIGHRTHYTKSAVLRVLSTAGFTVEKIEGAGFPFFNLYRLAVILRGEKLFTDVYQDRATSGPGTLAKAVMRMFRFLFRFNTANSPFGWQLVAVARR